MLAVEARAAVIGRPGSGEGLQDSVAAAGDFARALVTIDEAGHHFGGDSAKVPQHIRSVAEVLLRLFSDGAGIHITRPKAGTPSKQIRHPGIAMLAFSTPACWGRC